VPARSDVTALCIFIRHGLGDLRDLAEDGADGTFAVSVPRLPGFVIRALAPGWQPASAALPIRSDPCAVRLVLTKRSLTISGTVRTAQGEPLAGIDVTAFVVLRMTAEEYSRADYAGKGHGYKSFVTKRRNTARVVYLLYGRTDRAGGFEIPSNVKGELMLFAHADGDYRVCRRVFGDLSSDRTELDLVVEPGDGSMLQLRRSGLPLGKKRIIYADLSLEQQPTSLVALDEEGRLYASKLESGHRYSLRIDGVPLKSWYFVWNGQEVLDLDRLPTRPPWFKDRPSGSRPR